MIDYCLRFNSEAEAVTMLTGYEGNIDVIGVIYKPTGLMSEAGPQMASIPGWHVNVRGGESKVLQPFVVKVNTPVRVWA